MVTDIKEKIRAIQDFPKKGILFRDITTALKDADTMKKMVDFLYEHYKDKEIDYVAGMESRGFIVGMPLAYKLNVGFVPVRKPHKLPAETYQQTYELEYGTDMIEMHKDAVEEGSNVLIVDDLLATGGTAVAAPFMGNHYHSRVAAETGCSLTSTLSARPSRTWMTRSAMAVNA